MKFLFILALLGATARADLIDQELRGISQVETGGHPELIGRLGERTEYQIIFSVWRVYTSEPFTLASRDRYMAHEVARTHLMYLRQKLIEHHVRPTAFNLAVAWHSGLGVAYRGCSNIEQTHYALRIQHLLENQDIRRTSRRDQPGRR